MRAVLLIAAMLSGCADTSTCESALSDFYANGCAVTEPTNGAALSKTDAIAQCQADEDGVSDRCDSRWQSHLDCLAKARPGASLETCEYCMVTFNSWLDCEAR